jgi:hypothetical protein
MQTTSKLPMLYHVLHPYPAKHYRQYNPTSFVTTSHPTNVGFCFTDSNGNDRRPYLWEETAHYYSLLATHKIPHNTQTWIGYDMDRHQDEQDKIFIHTFLQNLRSTLLREEIGKKEKTITENHCIINKIEEISTNLVNLFEKKISSDHNIQSDLKGLKKLMDERKVKPVALTGHYRISADDLIRDDDKEKIKNRLKELANIKLTFGVDAVSEIIIADCTDSKQIDVVRGLIKSSGLKLNVTPLIEDDLDDKTLKDIIKNADKKVMLAGSDSIQRDTYIGALRMKLKIQKLLHQHNKEHPYDQKTFFEGAGSTINRNGCILPSRMGTILEGMPYERTIQGQEAEQFITNNNNHQSRTITEAQSPRCTLQQLEDALPLIDKLYGQLSQKHKALQHDTNHEYTNKFNKQKVFKYVYDNSHYGSRAKQPQDVAPFSIKNQRAITQNMIHIRMHFQPEMTYWNTVSYEIKNEIKNNLSNPIIQDILNQYTALWQGCDLNEAKQWITDSTLYHDFAKSHNAFKDFIKEIKHMPNCPKNLLLNNIDDHRPRFNVPHLSKQKMSPLQSKFMNATTPRGNNLFDIQGLGISSSQVQRDVRHSTALLGAGSQTQRLLKAARPGIV